MEENQPTTYHTGSKLHPAILIIAIIVVLVIIALAVYFNHSRKTSNNQAAAPFDPKKITITYPSHPQADGRDIYYNAQSIRFSGSGNFPLLDSPNATPSANLTDYIIASFVNWESIPGSKDRYMLLSEPAHNVDPTRQIPNKVRIGFDQKLDYYNNFQTLLGVEDLSDIAPVDKTGNYGPKRYKIDLLSIFNDNEINSIFKPGDVVVLLLYQNPLDNGAKEDFIDNNNIKVAQWVFIRRYNAKETLTKEVGRPIPFLSD